MTARKRCNHAKPLDTDVGGHHSNNPKLRLFFFAIHFFCCSGKTVVTGIASNEMGTDRNGIAHVAVIRDCDKNDLLMF